MVYRMESEKEQNVQRDADNVLSCLVSMMQETQRISYLPLVDHDISRILRSRHDTYDPGASQWFWPCVANVMQVVKDLEPFFVETEEPVKLFEEKVGESIVEARLHKADDQRQIVVITSDGPGAVKAVIKVGKAGLKSRFGHTKDLGDGSYEFSAQNTASDVLDF